MATWADICNEVGQELGVVQGNEALGAADVAFVLNKAQRLIDRWNAKHDAIYAQAFNSYTITPSLQPHTIGPSGTWSAVSRPVTIEAVNLVITTVSPNVRIPIALHDADWWARVSVQGITTSVPTDGYYQPDWPNGSLYLWPVPTIAYSIELETRLLLSATFTTGTSFSLPPGYHDAIVLTVAEECAGQFGAMGLARLPILMQKAKEARALIFENNVTPPRIVTRQAGMPGSGNSTHGDFNWRNGSVIGR